MEISRRGVLAGLGLVLPPFARAAGALKIVAAENMYGDVAQQLGAELVEVASILKNPNQDPHLFSATPSVARALAAADVVIVNGADYDPWMAGLLAAQPAPMRTVISVADLLGRKPGDNPHLWYDEAAMPALVKALGACLMAKDAANAKVYQQNAARLQASLAALRARIVGLRARFAGTKVTATEPVYGLMAQALGFEMRNQGFQLAVMNATEPSPSEVAAFEQDLRGKNVKILFYNSQVTDDLTSSLLALAHSAGVAVVGVSETEPPGVDYQRWMNDGLDAVEKALEK